jgi:hypothetical protein
VLSFIDSHPDLSPGFMYSAIVVGLVPTTVALLVSVATLVALFATGERAERAHLVLTSLLDALRALCRCGKGKP